MEAEGRGEGGVQKSRGGIVCDEGRRGSQAPKRKAPSGSRITIRTVFGIDSVLLLKRVRNASCETYCGVEV